KVAVYLGESSVIPNALQHFAEDEVGQPEALAAQFLIEPRRLLVGDASLIINPHPGVDNDHSASYSLLRPKRDSARPPSHSTLPGSRRIEVASVSLQAREGSSPSQLSWWQIRCGAARRIAWRMSRSSISTFVRIGTNLRVNISHSCVSFERAGRADNSRVGSMHGQRSWQMAYFVA